MLSADAIVNLHDLQTRLWHLTPEDGVAPEPAAMNAAAEANWLALVTRQHRANFDLWHIEDEARAPGAADTELAAVKRRVDRTNQLRNDLAETLDRTLLIWLEPQGLPNPAAELHSESPGLIVDRLSILSLKIFHTREEAERADLAGCLEALWQQTLAGTRRFKLYRQLKMYNDPSLNPAIYRKLPK
jgi:hypothetical protein